MSEDQERRDEEEIKAFPSRTDLPMDQSGINFQFVEMLYSHAFY